MNKNLLRSIMTLHGETYADIAALLGISEASVTNKMNEKGTEFRQGEISAIQKHYNLTSEQLINIFFS